MNDTKLFLRAGRFWFPRPIQSSIRYHPTNLSRLRSLLSLLSLPLLRPNAAIRIAAIHGTDTDAASRPHRPPVSRTLSSISSPILPVCLRSLNLAVGVAAPSGAARRNSTLMPGSPRRRRGRPPASPSRNRCEISLLSFFFFYHKMKF